MSYILDALKKSEQERGHGNAPNVQTVHSSSINYKKDSNSKWPYILTTAVLLNFIAISYFIYQQNTTTVTTNSPQLFVENINAKPSTAIQPSATQFIPSDKIELPITTDPSYAKNRIPPYATTIKSIDPKPLHTSKLSATESLETTNSDLKSNTVRSIDKGIALAASETLASETPVTNETLSNDLIINQVDLPESIARSLPTLTITAHIYSSQAKQRSMMINNQFLEEGDHIIDGVVLHEITYDGAIFDYNGLLFRNTSVSRWQ